MMSKFSVSEQVQSLRDLANFIEANPYLPWDAYVGADGRHAFQLFTDADGLTAFAASGGRWDKTITGEIVFTVERDFGAVVLRVHTGRDEVCERVVVGTETVEVPAVAARPKVTVEREIVEWKCRPLLASEVA